MKREELLTSSMGKEAGSIEVKLSEIKEQDTKYLSRTLQQLENELEDAESEMKKRLKAEATIDMSVVFVQYAGIKDIKNKISLLKEFKEKYI